MRAPLLFNIPGRSERLISERVSMEESPGGYLTDPEAIAS